MFDKLINVYLSPWFGARTLAYYGFTPQMQGVVEFVEAPRTSTRPRGRRPPSAWPASRRPRLSRAMSGNVFPTHIRAYQNWWARVQAARDVPPGL